MAVNISTIWECRASGAGVSDNNGGGWNPLRVSTFSGTDLVVDGSLNTKVTSATHNFVAADVGCRLQITAGTGWTTGFYTVNSVAANAATLNASPAAVSTTGGSWTEVGIDRGNQLAAQVAIGGGTVTTSITTNVISFTGGTYAPTNADVGNQVQMISGTNVTANSFFWIVSTTATTWTMDANVVSAGTTVNAVGNMGGAILTLAKLATNMLASNKAYCSGAFGSIAGLTFAQTSVATLAAPPTRLIGYGSTRGDTTHATMVLGSGTSGINTTGANFFVEQFDVDCNSVATSTGIILAGNNSRAIRCKASGFTTAGITMGAGTNQFATDCEVTGGTAAATAAVNHTGSSNTTARCFIHDNACPGIFLSTLGVADSNLVVNNSGASSIGIRLTFSNQAVSNTVHNNGSHGISFSQDTTRPCQVKNNILTTNGGYGLAHTTTNEAADASFDGNAYGGGAAANTLGTRNQVDNVTGLFGVTPYVNTDVLLTGSPYVGPTTGTTANFSLNDTAGAGRSCKGVGVPGTWPGNTGSTGYLDMGAVQHKDGGGTWVIVPTG